MRLVATLLAVTLSALAGCGGDADTQPRVGAPAFGDGRFEDVPVMPGSEPFGPPHEEHGVVARSFLLPSSTPQEVMRFYEREWTATRAERMSGWFGAPWTTIGWVVASTAAMYAAVLVGVRVAGRRTVARLSAFDTIVTIALGTLLSSTAVSSEPNAVAPAGALRRRHGRHCRARAHRRRVRAACCRIRR